MTREWYDIHTQKFYVHVIWERWFEQLQFKINEIYLLLARQQAKYLCELEQTYPVYVRLRVVESLHETHYPDVIIGVESIEIIWVELQLPIFSSYPRPAFVFITRTWQLKHAPSPFNTMPTLVSFRQ
ncbi:MAG: hypothetical protein R3E08_04250 [Thiotrichaceae bacterium]